MLALICISICSISWAARVDVQKEKEFLVKGYPPEQNAAMVKLVGAGKEGAVALCDVLETEKDAGAKSRAAEALQENLKNGSVDDAMMDRLERMTQSTGIAGLSSMAVMQLKGNTRARAILRKAAQKQQNDQVRAQILGALMVNIDGDKSEAPFVAEFLKDKSENVQVSAAGYLGALGDPQGAAMCKAILERKPTDDATRMLQMRAAIAAGRIGDPKLIPVLQKVASSKDYGLAQWQARTAVKDIELKGLASASEKLEYLKKALAANGSARWAVQQLMAMGTPNAHDILKWAAKEKNLAGAEEADQALAAIEANKNTH